MKIDNLVADSAAALVAALVAAADLVEEGQVGIQGPLNQRQRLEGPQPLEEQLPQKELRLQQNI